MLIKLRNEFYQVQCDAFGDLATDLLDIRPKILRAMSPDEKKSANSSAWFYGTEMKRVFRVDIHRRCRNI
ncbi:TPA: hypothetical protein MIC17_05935 [Klebsiella pneumoniae]|nr:hypothetical protein [Klebsiella pneumoniae]HBX4866577.1 hypothetical protein [Klebsiella pneumoniae]HBX6273219.1 hypothetical protein [Klebsiella pneumoniae]HBX6946140.1 hypothetical protein [Klebsiella pneumoniae]HBX7054572.1 hypothetical protein [Klebsiella pneumoniae]